MAQQGQQGQSQRGETVTGVVAAINERGLKLEHADAWLNFSRFSAFGVMPARGDTVRLVVAKGRFINSITALGGDRNDPEGEAEPDFGEAADALGGDTFTGFPIARGLAADAGKAATVAPRQVTPVPHSAPPPAAAPRAAEPDVTEVRRAALDAAIALTQGGDPPAVEDVLAVAERFARWIGDGEQVTRD